MNKKLEKVMVKNNTNTIKYLPHNEIVLHPGKNLGIDLEDLEENLENPLVAQSIENKDIEIIRDKNKINEAKADEELAEKPEEEKTEVEQQGDLFLRKISRENVPGAKEILEKLNDVDVLEYLLEKDDRKMVNDFIENKLKKLEE